MFEALVKHLLVRMKVCLLAFTVSTTSARTYVGSKRKDDSILDI